jgi:serine/threonine protein kinase
MESTDQFIGKTLGSCKINRKIGEGGMGAVYLAHHIGLDKNVAVKILPPWFSKDDERVKRFIREARSSASIEHLNIIQVFDIRISQPEGFYYIVMQYIDGESLDALIKRQGKLPLHEATRIIKDAASALAVAHNKGVIHRDIKAENIMLTKNGEVKLMDFGLAKIGNTKSSISSPGDIIGTPHYMSPEQARGEAVDARTDVYSLGITYYYALTGKQPFEGTTPITIIMKHLNEQPPDPQIASPDMPLSVKSILSKMLSKDLRKRYQSAKELILDLNKIVSGDPSDTKTVKLMAFSSRSSKYKRILLPIGISVVALIIILSIVTISKRGHPKALNPPSTSVQNPDKLDAVQLFAKAMDYMKTNPLDYEKTISNFKDVRRSFPNSREAEKANNMLERLTIEFSLKKRCESFCNDIKEQKGKDALSAYMDPTIKRNEKFLAELRELHEKIKSQNAVIGGYKIDSLQLRGKKETQLFGDISVKWLLKTRDSELIHQTRQIWKYSNDLWYLMPRFTRTPEKPNQPKRSDDPPEDN